MPFRLLLTPKNAMSTTAGKKGSQGFRKSKGFGVVQLKCEEVLGEEMLSKVEFHISVGQQPLRGPVLHDFSQSGAVCGLSSTGQDLWDFGKEVDLTSRTFSVRLEARCPPRT